MSYALRLDSRQVVLPAACVILPQAAIFNKVRRITANGDVGAEIRRRWRDDLPVEVTLAKVTDRGETCHVFRLKG